MFGVKAGRGWIGWLLKISTVLRGGNTAAVARSAVVCVREFHQVWKFQGMKGLVIRTKSLYILTMQAAGGQRIQSAQALGPAVARTSRGLPRIIPREHRRRIMGGDIFLLRLWLSWFSIYRVLAFPGVPKLKTITDPGVSFSNSLIKEGLDMIRLFGISLGYAKVGSALSKIPEVRFFPLTKSTPVLKGKATRVNYSPESILFSAHTLYNGPL